MLSKMKILAIGDPHGKLPRNLSRLIFDKGVDLIICTGDYSKVKMISESKGVTNNKDPRVILKELSSFDFPILTLKGNMYNNRKYKKIFTREVNKYSNVNYKTTGKVNILKQSFILFDVIYEKHNSRINLALSLFNSNQKREKKLNKLLKENKNSILISHNPPYGYVDKACNGKHVGSKIILDAIKRYQPKYVFCGHIHEAKGKAKIGNTIVYNLGSNGDYIVVDTETNKLLDSNFLR